MKIRAAAHVHSDWSHDGHWPLPVIAARFRKVGYHCVLMTEHDASFTHDRWQSYRRACAENSTDGFLLVPGIEYSDPENIVHILVWGDIPFLGAQRKTGDLLRLVRESRGVAVLAHPSRRSALQKYESGWGAFLLGVEQWNRKVDGVAPSSEALRLLRQDTGLLPFVGLDFHRANQFYPLYLALPIDGLLSEQAVLDGLRAKRSEARVAGVSIKRFSKGILHGAALRTENVRRYLRGIIKREKKRTVQTSKDI